MLMLCITVMSGGYQNYQNGAGSNQLTDNGRGVECVGDKIESAEV
jgi:hypothetical protein